MRDVIIKEKAYNWTTKEWEDLPGRKGKFHEWGVDFIETESGPGNFTVAIIELEDGSIDLVNPRFIVFCIDPIRDLVSCGHIIAAIKKHREIFGSSIKDAKNFIDKLLMEVQP